MEEILVTIEKPWREPMDYLQLAFWTVIFLIVVWAIWDGLRIVATYVAESID